ncbi:MAG: OmpA family protein [Rhodospirillales bacterium]|nr:OmpA family protein [Rhodospirillales bacterium]
MRALALPLLAVSVALAGPALAQSSPSASDIIQSLKPHGDLTAGGTRGIRLVGPGTAGPASPAQHASRPAGHRVASRAAPAGKPSVNLTVDFATGSADLTPSARATLDQLGKALASNDLHGFRFRIEGHTDTVGSPAANLTLSQQRAAAVAAYLEQTYGIAANRLQAVGMGEQGLLVPTPPGTANARNRRVEVINLGA